LFIIHSNNKQQTTINSNMGNFIAKVLDSLSGTTQKKILLLGLDAAGKTTILYKLNLGDTVNTIPTVGFNVENMRYKNIEMNCWDIGGQKKIRKLWYHYYEGTDAVIFVVDSNDPERLQEAKEELFALMDNDALRNASLLVYANKQDLPQSMSTASIVDKLELTSRMRGKNWHVQGAVAVTGDGLYDGLDWLGTSLQKQK
jgi:small GTP-binding protein